MMPGSARNWRRTSSIMRLRGAADGADRERGEEEDQRGADQPTDEYLRLGQVDNPGEGISPR